MTTKDHYCLKGNTQHFGSSNENGHQYSNLNLNANQKCSSILETFQSNKNISTSSNSKKNDYAVVTKMSDQINFGKNQNKNKFSNWNENGDGRNNFSKDTNIFGSTENSKKWKSDKKSTLSIHITAYENSVEAQNGFSSGVAEKKDGTNSSKTKINKVLKVLKTGFASMDAFEIPRQQTTETGTNEPEIMQFKASQKLFNPNQPPSSSLDTTTFSVFGQQKLKILVKIFIDKVQVNVIRNDFDEVISVKEVLPNIFQNAELSSKEFVIQSITVFDRKVLDFVSVSDDYLLQPFDKFELHLAKKIQETEMLIEESGTQEQQKLTIDTSKIQNIKDLTEFLSAKLDVKEERINFVKFDDDFGGNITVNDEEKFDPTNVYNSEVTKILKFTCVVRPRLTVASNNPNKSNSETAKFEAGLDAAASVISSNIETTLIPVSIAPKSPMAVTTKDNIKSDDLLIAKNESEKSELKDNFDVNEESECVDFEINDFSVKKKLKWDYNYYKSMNKPVIFFQSLFGFYSVLNLSEEKLLILSKIILQYYQDPWLQTAFAPALKNHCRFLLHSLYDHTFHYFFSHLMTAPNSIPIKEFVEGFDGFSLNKYYMFARTLAEIGWTLKNRDEPDIVGRLRWFIDEFSRADLSYKSEIFHQILANQSIDYYGNCKNLKELIDTVH